MSLVPSWPCDSPEWLPLHHLPHALGEGDARGLWAGTVVGGTPGLSLPWPGSCLWSCGQALKFSPRATLIKSGSRAWETHTEHCLVRSAAKGLRVCQAPTPTHPSLLACLPGAPPGLTTDPPRDPVHSQEPRRPRVAPGPLWGFPPNQGHPPRGLSQPPSSPLPALPGHADLRALETITPGRPVNSIIFTRNQYASES